MRNQYVVEYVSDGVSEKQRGNYGKALELYDKALAIDNTDFDALYAKAKLLFILGRYEDSKFQYGLCAVILVNTHKNFNPENINPNDITSQIWSDPNFRKQALTESINQLADHCGHALAAIEAYANNAPGLISSCLAYRSTIDPYYKRNNPEVKIYPEHQKKFDEWCLVEGLNFLGWFIKRHDELYGQTSSGNRYK